MSTPAFRKALVTGASSGLGEAFACLLAEQGTNLVLVARRKEPLDALASRLSEHHAVDVEVAAADLTRELDVANLEGLARDAELDLLVNNAGIGSEGPFIDSDIDVQVRTLRLDVEAVLRLTHAVLPGMVSRGRGAVINVSSGLAFLAAPEYATYAASKAFVNSFSEAIAEELRDTGVRVQALCPGLIRTEFQQAAGVDASRFPSFAWMEPDDVARDSLAALERGGVVHVPGLGNRIALGLTSVAPRGLATRLLGRVNRFGRDA